MQLSPGRDAGHLGDKSISGAFLHLSSSNCELRGHKGLFLGKEKEKQRDFGGWGDAVRAPSFEDADWRRWA